MSFPSRASRFAGRAPRLRSALATLVCIVPTASAQDIEPFGAEDFASEKRVVHIPEPMVFDLVRSLGAHQGEFEVNVLGVFPLSDLEDREIEWAPEVELAIFDGVAVEFELPFESSRLEAFKSAGQVTFGTGFGERFIHGAQLIVEKLRTENIWELSPLYIAGFRFDRRWSVLGMLGYRTEVGDESENSHELLVNPSIFLDLTSRMSAGLETNFSTDFEGDWHLLTIPQLHYELFDHVTIQAGVGLQLDSGTANGTAAARLIAAW